MLKNAFLVFSVLMTNMIYCQNKSKVNIFLDENLNQINEQSFSEKRQSFIYYSRRIENDTLIVNRIIQNIKFGKLDSIENFQIKQLIKRHSRIEEVMNKTLIITFRDTLFGYKEYNKRRIYNQFDKSYYDNKLKQYDRNQKKCIKKDLKNDHLRLYFYNFKYGYDYQPENFEWKSSSNIINNYLFKNNSSMILLKPDGEYFYFVETYEKLIEELLETDDWTLYKNDYQLALETMIGEPFGMLKSMYKPEYLQIRQGVRNSSLHCYYKGDY